MTAVTAEAQSTFATQRELQLLPPGADTERERANEPGAEHLSQSRRHLHLIRPSAPAVDTVPADAAPAARAAARGIIEALAGARPVAHLASGCDLPSYEKLRRRVRWEREASHDSTLRPSPAAVGARGESARRELRLLSTHTQGDRECVEASATFCIGGRVRAIGFRMEPHRGHWRITAVDFG